MKVLVLVKGVVDPGPQPSLSEGRLTSGDVVLDHYGKYALEAGLQLAQDQDDQGSVTAASVGPDSETALRDALALGAQDAIEVKTDQENAGLADILAQAVNKEGPFDLVLCGDQATDDSQGVLPAQLAAALGWPLVDAVDALGLVGPRLCYTSLLDKGAVKGTVQLPAVVSVLDTINKPRLPSFRLKMAAKRYQIKEFQAESSQKDPLEKLEMEEVPASSKEVIMVDSVDDLIRALDQVGIRLKKE